MRTVASYHHKGGVGKTTTAVALAANAAAAGHRTLLWDLDPQGSATRLVGVDRGLDGGVTALFDDPAGLAGQAVDTAHERLQVVPADLSLRGLDRWFADGGGVAHGSLVTAIERASADLDLLVLDCQPAVSAASAAVLRAADLVVVPLTAGPLAWSAFADLDAEIDAMTEDQRPDVLAFLTMVDRRKGLHRDLVDDIEPTDGFSQVAVPTDSRVERMALATDPLRAVLGGRAGSAYRSLWQEIEGSLRGDVRGA